MDEVRRRPPSESRARWVDETGPGYSIEENLEEGMAYVGASSAAMIDIFGAGGEQRGGSRTRSDKTRFRRFHSLPFPAIL